MTILVRSERQSYEPPTLAKQNVGRVSVGSEFFVAGGADKWIVEAAPVPRGVIGGEGLNAGPVNRAVDGANQGSVVAFRS